MDEMMKTMMMQLGSESAADEAGRAPPDMPDLSKLITQMTSSMMNNPNMQKLMGGGSQHLQTNKPKLLTHRLCVSLQELFNGAALREFVQRLGGASVFGGRPAAA